MAKMITCVESYVDFGLGRNEWGKGQQFPGRRITAGDAEKSQQCHKYFPQCNTFASKTSCSEHGGAKLASCPGRHLNSLRPWVRVRFPRNKWCSNTSIYLLLHSSW